MKRMKLLISRFDDSTVDMGTLLLTLETKAKGIDETKAKTTSFLNKTKSELNDTISVFDKLSKSGSVSVSKLRLSIKSLMTISSELNKKIGNVGKEKYVTEGFADKKAALQNKFIMDKMKIGFTGGESEDPKQLMKDFNILVSHIRGQMKLIENEQNDRVKGVNNEISALQKKIDIEEKATQKQQAADEKEKAQKQAAYEAEIRQLEKIQAQKEKIAAQQEQERVKIDFQQSYTDVGSTTATTAYREQYNALMSLLTAEQQDTVVKKLMREESKKLVNSTVEQIQYLKQLAMASQQPVTPMDKLRNIMNKLDETSKRTKNNFKKFIDQLKHVAVTWRIIGGVLRSMINTFANLYDKAASYEEALNLYRVAMGEWVDEADAWAKRISEALYLDPKTIMQYTGAFYNLVQGLGVSSEAAYKMSTNLTQLSYDMSSYLNIDVEAAHDKLQSAITGQSRAVASAGIAMQQASLQELAYSLGITKLVTNMTQAEKTYLRYIQIMRSTTNMQGDLARTIITPENALRVIKTQFELLGRAMGQVFIPIVLKVIPYIMVLTEALKRLATWLGKLLGYKMADIDYSGLTTADTYLEGLGDTAEDTAGRVAGAADKINRSLAPFDELNVVESESAGSGGGTGGGLGSTILGDLEKYIDGYDMLNGLTEDFNKQLDTARENIKKMIPFVKAVGVLLLTWKLTTTFLKGILFAGRLVDAIKSIKLAFGKEGIFSGLAGGFTLAKIPLVGEAGAAFSLIGDAIGEMIAGTMTLSEGFSFIASALGPIIGLLASVASIIVGVVRSFQGVKQFIEGNNLKGFLEVLEGVALVVAGIAALFTAWPVVIVAALVAVVAAVVEYWDDIKKYLSNWWKDTTNKINSVASVVSTALKPVTSFILDNVIKPVYDKLKPLFDYVKEAFDSIMDTVKLAFNSIKTIFIAVFAPIWESFKTNIERGIEIIKTVYTAVKTVVDKVGEIIFKMIEITLTVVTTIVSKIYEKLKPIFDWVYNNVIEPIVKALTGIVKSINEKVIQPLINKFTGLWTALVSLFKGAGSTLANAIYSGFKNVMNLLFSTIESKINSFINTLNTKVIDKVNEAVPSGKKISRVSTVSLPRFEKGGYPDSGDLFFANENGNAEYITSLGNRTAVANQDQMVTALTNAILEGMSAIETKKQPNHIVVNVGNKKLYEGQGQYQNREADRYGTTYVAI